MSLQCGIVGLPNVGKSTLFNALTKSSAPAENFPFCTIDPHVGIVNLPDSRLDKLKAIYKPEKVTPATVEFIDIAGLVEGANKGEGLGNKFLGQIRETSAIIHVVRCFNDSDIVHVNGEVNPIRDAEIIETELLLADLDTLERKLDKTKKLARGGDKRLKIELGLLERLIDHCGDGLWAKSIKFTEEEFEILDSYEGTQSGDYKRFPVNVVDVKSGKTYKATTYVAYEDKIPKQPPYLGPSDEYLEFILQGGRWHKLPKKSSESRFEHDGSQEGTFGDNGTQFGNATDR